MAAIVPLPAATSVVYAFENVKLDQLVPPARRVETVLPPTENVPAGVATTWSEEPDGNRTFGCQPLAAPAGRYVE
jgi:hypothetical protein